MLATPKNFERLLAPFRGQPRLILDTETTGLHCWTTDRVVGLSLATPDLRHRVYAPVRHEVGENITASQYRQITKLLSARGLILTGWNCKFDVEMLLQDGLRLPRTLEDVMLACHLLNENDKPFELKRWAAKHVDPSAGDAEAALEKRLRQVVKEQGIKGIDRGSLKAYIKLLDPAEAEPYACDDVYYTEVLRRLVLPHLRRWRLSDLWRESNRYLWEVLRMEMRGMKLDVALMEQYSKEAKKNYRRAEKNLFRIAGHEINPRSPKQLCAFLGTTSSRKEIVSELGTPEAEALLSYRNWFKVENDYYSVWRELRDASDVLHPNLLLHGTGTGRQSARTPPLHGTPRYRPEYKVRNVIIARPGYLILSADYQQNELRIAASLAEEEKMAAIFASGGDIHQAVADALRIGGPDPRSIGKNINFATIYGAGASKLSLMAKIPFEEADKHLRQYRTTYWRLRYTAKAYQRLAESQGYIRLWTGRVRHFNSEIFAQPRDAFNSAVQGGGAEMLRIAICRMAPQLRKLDAWILLQIHDSVLVEVPLEQVVACAQIIKREMENFPHWMVPPVVDLKLGTSWGNMKELVNLRRIA